MWDFKLGEIIGLIMKTLPFVIFRLAIYMGITLLYIIVTGGGAGIGFVAGKVGGDPAAGAGYGGLIGFGLVSTVLYFAREYLLYMVKAGHIAVLERFLAGQPVPDGKGQVEYAQARVKENFGESSALFAVDQLIKGILKTFNRITFSIANFLPIPGLGGAMKLVNAVLNMSMTYLDEVILAYHLRTGSDNIWQSSQRALVLYAQNYKSILKNAAFLAFFIWLLTFGVFLVVLAPVAGLIALFPALAGFWTFAFAALLAYGIKAAVIDPIAMTALMQVYFKSIEGQEPNPEWEQKLAGMSSKFRELKDKATSWGGGPSPDPSPPPAA
ncbi:MAG: hypothetical protein AAF358_06640 [Pseudomonadota bacterium]